MTFEELPQGFKDWKSQYACDDPGSPGYNIRDLYAAYTAGVQAERERCAEVAEADDTRECGCSSDYECNHCAIKKNIAAAIRGQG